MIEAWIDGSGREHFAAFGVARLSARSQVDQRTVFHMASVTKPFVATAMLQLAERGRIDLDASPVRYLPYLRIEDPRAGAITIRQMLNHTSALPDIDDYEWGKGAADDGALERWVRGLSGIRLVDRPGAAFHYSNLAYDLLGDVIAKASGVPFETYMRRHVLAPLRMRHTSLLLADVDRHRLAAPHMPKNGRAELYPVFPYNRVHAGSSTLYADAADMLRWARYWAGSGTQLLSRPSRAAMLQPAVAIDRADRAKWRPAMGLGWFLLALEGRHIAYHMGQDIGFTTGMMVEPGTGRAVVVMSNIATEAESDRLFDLSLRRMMTMHAPPPATHSGPYVEK